jgi:hypothetical protein
VPDEAPQDEHTPDPAPDSADTAEASAAHEATTPSGYSYTLVDDAAADGEPPAQAKSPRGGVPLLLAAVAAIVPTVIVGVVVWLLASSGGGGGTSRLGADMTTLLNAFSQGQTGTTTARYEGALAPGFPNDIPQYPGAKLLSSLSQVRGGDVSYVVIYDTKDSRDNVAALFASKFKDDPWQIDGGQDSRESTLHQFSKINDSNVTGLVLVGSSNDGKTTMILESVQVTSGAKDAKAPGFSAVAGRTLPDGYPDAVPAYTDATLIESAYQKKSGANSYAVSYITKGDASGVLDFYRNTFKDAQVAVQDGDATTSALEDAQAIQFTDAAKTLAGGITVGKFADDATYTRIDITVQLAKAPTTP